MSQNSRIMEDDCNSLDDPSLDTLQKDDESEEKVSKILTKAQKRQLRLQRELQELLKDSLPDLKNLPAKRATRGIRTSKTYLQECLEDEDNSEVRGEYLDGAEYLSEEDEDDADEGEYDEEEDDEEEDDDDDADEGEYDDEEEEEGEDEEKDE